MLFIVHGIKAAHNLLFYVSNIVIMNKSIRRKGNRFKSTEGVSIHNAVLAFHIYVTQSDMNNHALITHHNVYIQYPLSPK